MKTTLVVPKLVSNFLFFAGFIFTSIAFVGSSQAAVPVEDIRESQAEATPNTIQTSRVPAPSNSSETVLLPEPTQQPAPSDSFSQLQLLQVEVMELRGLVEQLNNDIQLLKQRQMDDYMDLDRRLSNNANTAATTSAGAAGPAPAPALPTSAGGDTASDEVQSYSSAYNLLKEGKIDNAVSAFKEHIQRYPSGVYTPNCHYWLGEVYLLKNNLEQARQSFTVVVDNYPDHRKLADATFKLGKVYHLQGNNPKAKALLEKVADGSSRTAPLAKKYLNDNF